MLTISRVMELYKHKVMQDEQEFDLFGTKQAIQKYFEEKDWQQTKIVKEMTNN